MRVRVLVSAEADDKLPGRGRTQASRGQNMKICSVAEIRETAKGSPTVAELRWRRRVEHGSSTPILNFSILIEKSSLIGYCESQKESSGRFDFLGQECRTIVRRMWYGSRGVFRSIPANFRDKEARTGLICGQAIAILPPFCPETLSVVNFAFKATPGLFQTLQKAANGRYKGHPVQSLYTQTPQNTAKTAEGQNRGVAGGVNRGPKVTQMRFFTA